MNRRWIRRAVVGALIPFAACSTDAEPAAEAEEPVAAAAPAEEEAATEAAGDPAEAPAAAPATPQGGNVNPLMNPADPEMNHMAPATFRVRFETSEGDIVVEVNRAWAPHGADRFFNLVRNGFFDGARFFRVLDGFVAQFGINGDPRIQARWRNATIPPDPVVEGNTRGRLTYAMGGRPNTRSTQLFINFEDNSQLDSMGFAAIGEVVEGMDVAESLYSGYGEGEGARPGATGPNQQRIQTQGNAYLEAEFPELDYIIKAEVISDG